MRRWDRDISDLSAEYMNHNRIPHMALTFKSSAKQIQLPIWFIILILDKTPMEMSCNNAKPSEYIKHLTDV